METEFKIGDRVVNTDSYVGEVIEVDENRVTMRFEKAGNIKEETWNKGSVRLANDTEDGI